MAEAGLLLRAPLLLGFSLGRWLLSALVTNACTCWAPPPAAWASWPTSWWASTAAAALADLPQAPHHEGRRHRHRDRHLGGGMGTVTAISWCPRCCSGVMTGYLVRPSYFQPDRAASTRCWPALQAPERCSRKRKSVRSLITCSAKETVGRGPAGRAAARGRRAAADRRLGAGKSSPAGWRRTLDRWPIPSPTFTLLNLYDQGAAAEALRLVSPERRDRAGRTDRAHRGAGVTTIEWHERARAAASMLPRGHHRGLGEDRRHQPAAQGGFRRIDVDWQTKGERA